MVKEAMDYSDFENCGLKKALTMLSGKWKPMILHYLFLHGEFRFNDLWRSMPRVSKKVLADHLRQMESNGIVKRHETKGFPPEVQYALTERGKSLGPILAAMEKFGNG